MLAIGVSLFSGWSTLAWSLEALLLVALGALIFGRFCLGSYLFLLITGRLHSRTERFHGLVPNKAQGIGRRAAEP